MERGPVAPEQSTGAVWRCLYCRGELRSGELALRCAGCGKQYPVAGGVPLLVREAAAYFRGQCAALRGAAREARRRRELVDVDGVADGWPAATLKRHRDVSETEAAQAEALFALIGTPFSETAPNEHPDGMQAVRPGWDVATMIPYLVRDWSDTSELRDTSLRIGEALRRAFPDPRGKSVVFAGCGAAGLLAEMPPGFARVVGFDLTLPVLAAARQLLDGATLELPLARALNETGRVSLRRRDRQSGKSAAELVVMDALDTAFPDGSVDCVVTVFLTDILPDPRALADEIRRVLREGGVWINYGPSGNDLKAVWRFDQTEGAAFFELAGFEVVGAEARRGTNLDISTACPSASFRNVLCYLTAAKKAARPGEEPREGPPGPDDLGPIVPRHFPGARLAHPLEDIEAGNIQFQHDRVPGRGESWQIGGRAARILTLVDGKRSVRDIALLLSRRNPPHPIEETLRVFARFFDQGLLSWREDPRETPYRRH
jgi:SAM-dependent methyltransferase